MVYVYSEGRYYDTEREKEQVDDIDEKHEPVMQLEEA